MTLILLSILATAPACCHAMMPGGDVREDHAAMWKGRIWYLKKNTSRGIAALYSLAPGESGAPRLEIKIDVKISETWLLADGDRLWIIADDSVSYFKGGAVHSMKKTKKLGEISRPFIYKGKPALTEKSGYSLYLDVFDGGEWRSEGELVLLEGVSDCGGVKCMFEVVSDSAGELHFFGWDRDAVYYHKGVPFLKKKKAKKDNAKETGAAAGTALKDNGEEKGNGKSEWEFVGEADGSFSAALIGGRPAVFLSVVDGLGSVITGYSLEGGKWREIYKKKKALFYPSWFAVYPVDGGEPDEFVMIRQAVVLFGPVYSYTFKGGKKTSSVRIGVYTIFGVITMAGIFIIILAIYDLLLRSIGPFWWFTTGVTVFSETRRFQHGQLDCDKIMAMDFSHTKTYIVNKWPERRAITFKMKWPLNGSKAIPSILYFTNTPGGICLKIVSKTQVLYLMALLIMNFIVFSMCNDVIVMMIGNAAIMRYAMMALCILLLILTGYEIVRSARKGGKELFDLALTVFGVEKLPEAKPML